MCVIILSHMDDSKTFVIHLPPEALRLSYSRNSLKISCTRYNSEEEAQVLCYIFKRVSLIYENMTEL